MGYLPEGQGKCRKKGRGTCNHFGAKTVSGNDFERAIIVFEVGIADLNQSRSEKRMIGGREGFPVHLIARFHLPSW